MVECKDTLGRTASANLKLPITKRKEAINIQKDIINASGKKIGYVDISDEIVISNSSKPVIKITNKQHIKSICNKEIAFIKSLYDDYTLTVAEIAALYDMKYFQTANIIKTLDMKTNKRSGRRNSSYALQFSNERLKNMSLSQQGHKPVGYIMTQDVKDRISSTLKDGYKSGRLKQNGIKQSEAWANGKYTNAKMGRGIQGYFHSIKNNKDMYFRSLLELKFLIKIEEDEKVIEYDTEPFQIKLPHKRHYTPDVIINNKIIVELKPYNHYKYHDFTRFHIEMACLNKYCNKNNLGFVIIYDTDIGFTHREYRRYLKNNPDIIRQYNIRFKKEI